MIIKSISLTNFRSYAHHHLECQPTTTLILGANGSGKTSILEAIYILTCGKSFRASDPDIIKRGTDFYHISLEYASGETCSASFDGHAKTFTFADTKSSYLPSQHKYPVIFFEPQDLTLVTGSPARRRSYFDNVFSQLSSNYAGALSRYNKALQQRNRLLKVPTTTKADLFPWNLLLARYGTFIQRSRVAGVARFNTLIDPAYHSIAKNQDHISLSYSSIVTDLTEERYLSILDQDFQKDLCLGYTTFSIGHDDIKFIFNHCDASGSASRGESRSIILALKFSEANLIINTLHQRPLVLLDDVFSELDDSRRHCLVDNFQHHQVIITSVEDYQPTLATTAPAA